MDMLKGMMLYWYKKGGIYYLEKATVSVCIPIYLNGNFSVSPGPVTWMLSFLLIGAQFQEHL